MERIIKKILIVLLGFFWSTTAHAKKLYPAIWKANPDGCVEALQRGNIFDSIQGRTMYVQYQKQIWLVSVSFTKGTKEKFLIDRCMRTDF